MKSIPAPRCASQPSFPAPAWLRTLIFSILSLVALPASLKAQDYSYCQANISIFSDWDQTKGILSVAHPSSELSRVEFNGVGGVVDSRGNRISGEYNLSYTFRWHSSFDDKDHITNVRFFFDRYGYFDSFNISSPTTFMPPFAMSNLVFGIAVELCRKELRESGTDTDRAIFETLVQSGDVKEIVTFFLKLNQRSKLR